MILHCDDGIRHVEAVLEEPTNQSIHVLHVKRKDIPLVLTTMAIVLSHGHNMRSKAVLTGNTTSHNCSLTPHTSATVVNLVKFNVNIRLHNTSDCTNSDMNGLVNTIARGKNMQSRRHNSFRPTHLFSRVICHRRVSCLLSHPFITTSLVTTQ